MIRYKKGVPILPWLVLDECPMVTGQGPGPDWVCLGRCRVLALGFV